MLCELSLARLELEFAASIQRPGASVERQRGAIHLMVTDIVMPYVDGPRLAEHLLQLHPEMKLLYMSGYTDETIVRHGVLREGTHFLQKPFTEGGLARKVRQVLDAPA